ncbi:hypothetical protein C6P44_002099, partial [Monosporozyma unispora]
MSSGRDKGTEDLVDQAFDLGHSFYAKAYQLVTNLGDATLKTVNELKDTIGGEPAEALNAIEPLHASLFGSSSRRNIWSSGLGGTFKQHLVLGLGVSASTILLSYTVVKALRIPKAISRDETQVILILGDYGDPIIRSQVLDFYRRNYTVFICSETVDRFKLQQEDFENLYFINPQSNDDLYKFTKLFENNWGDKVNKLAAIIFTPNLSYFTPGEVSLDILQYEIRSNILINYNTLLKILPHIPKNQTTQLILLNPSLSYNLENVHHPAEMFISGFITSIYKSMRNYDSLKVFMIHIGLFQVRGQLSNYKYMKWHGSDINKCLHDPIYRLIRRYNGNFLQRLFQRINTFNGRWSVYYMGKYSLLAT